nr:head GIN domain-containing protein [uncultured Carboxylicivirga sp.]
MKIISTLILSFTLICGLQAQDDDSNIQKQVRKMGSFDRVKASKGVNVTLIEGDKESVEVNIRNGELGDVITELKSRQLVVKMKTRIYKDMAVQVYVTYKTIREIETGSGGSIDAENTIYADKLKIRAGTDSNIELDVDVNAIEASGNAARIELSGACKVQEVNMGTGGKYLSYPLESNEAVVKSTLGSNVEITVNEKLNASTGTGGAVYYKGEPSKIQIKGKVQEAD